MLTLPKIDRAEQPYVAIKSRITVEEIGATAQNLMPKLFSWLGGQCGSDRLGQQKKHQVGHVGNRGR